MSDASDATPQRPTSIEDRTGWRAYWAAQGTPWRTEPEIDAERQRYLAERRAVHPNIEKGVYPFRDEHGGRPLTRADVEWLLETHESGGMRGPVEWKMEKGKLPEQRRWGLDLRVANLSGTDLRNLPLARVYGGIRPSHSDDLPGKLLEMAGVQLAGVDLRGAHLENALLWYARLEGIILSNAYLAQAELFCAHLEKADLTLTHLEGADLRGAFFDAETDLDRVHLGAREIGVVRIANIRWDSVNLVSKDWAEVSTLGDELVARQRKTPAGKRKTRPERRSQYEEAVRANRQLAVALRSQGLNEHADRFAYRAHVLQQQVLWRQGQFGRYFGTLLLWLVAGYGYKPVRCFGTYLLVVLGFATLYYLFGNGVHPALTVHGAIVFSLTSFHGRGFAPSSVLPPDNLLTTVAAIEAVIGLLIEITFIATFTQRFFAR